MGGVSVLVPTSERRDAGIANDATARKAGATVKRRRDSRTTENIRICRIEKDDRTLPNEILRNLTTIKYFRRFS